MSCSLNYHNTAMSCILLMCLLITDMKVWRFLLFKKLKWLIYNGVKCCCSLFHTAICLCWQLCWLEVLKKIQFSLYCFFIRLRCLVASFQTLTINLPLCLYCLTLLHGAWCWISRKPAGCTVQISSFMQLLYPELHPLCPGKSLSRKQYIPL